MSTQNPVVETPYGRVSGQLLGGAQAVTRFLGLPYAAPPVGAGRLRSPRPLQPWTGVRDGSTAAPASLQTLGGNQVWMNEPIERQDEDCLYLNVWTPSTTGRAPVLLWLHGGQTRNGHGAAPGIDGAVLAALGLVVVTINYRLGALGGLAHPELADTDTGLCANWGLQDKLAALAWVQRCIAAFGGDPQQVTLGGQSSGAANAALMAQHGRAHGNEHQRRHQRPAPFGVGLARRPFHARKAAGPSQPEHHLRHQERGPVATDVGGLGGARQQPAVERPREGGQQHEHIPQHQAKRQQLRPLAPAEHQQHATHRQQRAQHLPPRDGREDHRDRRDLVASAQPTSACRDAVGGVDCARLRRLEFVGAAVGPRALWPRVAIEIDGNA